MKPLHLLLVSLRETWRDSLLDSLSSAGYIFKVKEVMNKKEALQACNHARYDALITSCCLPDGASADLVRVLGNAMPCLMLRDGCPPDSIGKALFPAQAAQIPPPAKQPQAWVKLLEKTIRQWESAATNRINQGRQNQHMLFNKAVVRCASELHYHSENSIDNVLGVMLDVLEVSRVYIREALPGKHHPSRLVHEISASGQMPALGPHRSVHEVLLSESNGSERYLGIEDTVMRRTWNRGEADLMSTVATLLNAAPEGMTRPASGWLNNILRGNTVFMAS